MNTSKIILEEKGIEIQNFKTVICKLIENQIHDYKIQYLADWEANHKLPSNNKDQKIKTLQSAKSEIMDFLEQLNSEENKINFKLNLELALVNKIQIKKIDTEMIAS